LNKAKPFSISKRQVWEAFKQVKANQGAAGVDGQSIAAFEEDLENNLYKLWNRMASGSYFPPPVRRVEIAKGTGGGTRPLGIPTVSDRVAQTVVKAYLEPELEKHFLPNSYGYRRGKSAIEAVGVARQRCWRYDWVLDLDIRSYFDSIDWGLLMRAVRKHTDCKWVLLYLERWLKAPVQLVDGTLVQREKGTAQGAVVSPLLANLFLHYAFDVWMRRHWPQIPFERFADDAICHCTSEIQARELRVAIERRFADCRLELHPDKTKIVYCQDGQRTKRYPDVQFDFLGFRFQPRLSKSRWGNFFVNFSPAVSAKAAKSMRRTLRSWKIHRWTQLSIEELAESFNPVLRGWINYYGSYYKSSLASVFQQLDFALVRWAKRKYKRRKGSLTRAREWVKRLARRQPRLFAHWALTHPGTAGR